MLDWWRQRRELADMERDLEAAPDNSHLEEEILELKSQRLRRQAARWNVEIPDDAKVQADAGYYYISRSHQEKLNVKIVRARRDKLTWWIGPVGGILGFASFFKSCF